MMTAFGFNTSYLTKDDKPWFPMMGEIHYSRYPQKYWKESLYKMKAGGIDIVSAYAIWIHHEEIEGEYDFNDNKDLRGFVTACKECGLYLLFRIGPWVHGEVRNGGFPDWLVQKGYKARSNDPGYLKEVRNYYTELYKQVQGLLCKDGGPIIGIQIENELGHCGGASGEAGEEHIRTLHRMAVEIGFDVPYYTATGWGGAITGGLLPVMGGYPEAPWEHSLTELEPSSNYVFSHERNDHNIGSDFGIGEGVTFDYADFPYLCAELGGGMQVTYQRRPVAEAEDIGAMTIAKLGSGVNLLGYYMYHGGTNPKGKVTTLQETRFNGYSDYAELNYDFRAPIREFGQMSDTLKEIKLYAMFVKDFGSEFCSMPVYLPESNPDTANNLTDLRYAFRHNDRSGYVFINNYQRRYPMAEHENVKLVVDLLEETVTFPEITIKDRDYYFLPFNMKLSKAVLKRAMVTPLCCLNNTVKSYVFYGDREPGYLLQGDMTGIELIDLSRKDALNAWKVKLKQEHLIISTTDVLQTDQGIELIGREKLIFRIYPDLSNVPDGFVRSGMDGIFTVYEKLMDVQEVPVGYRLETESAQRNTYEIELKIPQGNMEDCFLQITYQGDYAKLYRSGEFIADHFYVGKEWEVGLKQFDFPEKLTLEVYPLQENAEMFLETWPDMKNGIACELNHVSAQAEYKALITYKR